MKRRFALKAAVSALAASGIVSLPAFAADTIKVGVLHSLSGTMAISETVLKDTVMMPDRRPRPRASCRARRPSR